MPTVPLGLTSIWSCATTVPIAPVPWTPLTSKPAAADPIAPTPCTPVCSSSITKDTVPTFPLECMFVPICDRSTLDKNILLVNAKFITTFSTSVLGLGSYNAVASITFFAGVNCGCLGSNSLGSTLKLFHVVFSWV